MFSDPFGEKDPLGDHVLANSFASKQLESGRKRKSNIAICERWVKIAARTKKKRGSLEKLPRADLKGEGSQSKTLLTGDRCNLNGVAAQGAGDFGVAAGQLSSELSVALSLASSV